MKRIQVMLVDDHALVRAGIRSLIDQLTSFVVIAEASSPDEAIHKLEQSLPDIVVTDISMGTESGFDLLRYLKQRFPKVAIVVLSMHTSEEIVAEALRLGASAYLVKEAAPAELEIALRAVMRESTYLSPVVSTRIIERFIRQPDSTHTALQPLTTRQRQILTMIANRKCTKEIAYELDLSEKTVAAHRAQIMTRVGVRDIVGLVLFAVKHGLVSNAPV